MRHITFDLETLGNSSQAPIVQIGAVEFGEAGEVLRAPFCAYVDLTDHWKLFKPDLSTLLWWLNPKQDPARPRVFFPPHEKKPLPDVLRGFTRWVSDTPGRVKLWSHATFDPPILTNAYQTLKIESGLPYRDFMDIRTLNFIAGDIGDLPPRESFGGAHHDALADCKFQAYYIARMLKKVGVRFE